LSRKAEVPIIIQTKPKKIIGKQFEKREKWKKGNLSTMKKLKWLKIMIARPQIKIG